MSRYRKGENKPQAGRAARNRVGSAMSPQRRTAVLAAVATRYNAAAQVVTAAAYLADTLGADPDFTRRYSSPFGKAAAKVYREQYGTDPELAGMDLRGRRLVRVNTYPRDVLEKAAGTYKRTAALALAA